MVSNNHICEVGSLLKYLYYYECYYYLTALLGTDLPYGDGIKRDLWVPGEVPSISIHTTPDR